MGESNFTVLLVLSLLFFHVMGSKNITSSNNIKSILSAITNFDSSLAKVPNVSKYTGVKRLSFIELATKYGHTAEQYKVTTEDGYILTIFRLRGTKNALPVLLQHGLCDTADTWIIRGSRSLSITLANNGYDVWLGNNRGNRYSQEHLYLSPKDPSYWDFTFNEIGKFDLPATIDLILNETGAEKLNAFGHSQGNTIFYVLLSTRTEYNDKVNVMTALAPVCYLNDIQPPLGILIKYSQQLYEFGRTLGVTNIFGDNSIFTKTLNVLAQIPILGYAVVADGILFELGGFDSEELEPAFIPTAGLYIPTWTSLKDLEHFGQVSLRKTFAQYDHGEKGNLAIYNSTTPPEYDLSKVTAKVVLLAGKNDKISLLEDVDILRKQLPNIVQYIVIPRKKMTHFDYIWGRNAREYLFKYIFNVLETYK